MKPEANQAYLGLRDPPQVKPLNVEIKENAAKVTAAINSLVNDNPVTKAVVNNPFTQIGIALVDGLKAVSDSPGAAPIHAAVRQGADEFAQVLVAFPANGIQPVAEQGQLFEPT